MQRDAELVVGLEQLRVDVGQRLRPVLVLLRRGVVRNRLEVDGRVMHVRPRGLRHARPAAKRLEPPVEHERRLLLLRRDHADDVLVEPGRDRVARDVRDEAVPVLATDEALELGLLGGHQASAADRRARRAGDAREIRGRERRLAPHEFLEADARRARARIARLMRCQPWPTRQVASRSQLPAPPAHSVRATGPSTASMISAALISAAGTGELVAAVRPAHGAHEARVLQFLEELADRRQRRYACGPRCPRRSRGLRPRGSPGSRSRSPSGG